MKAYITDKVLTKGIRIVEGDNLKISGNSLIEYHPTFFNTHKGKKYPITIWSISKPNWHETFEEAFAYAASEYGKEMAAIKRRVDRLEKLMHKGFRAEQTIAEAEKLTE